MRFRHIEIKMYSNNVQIKEQTNQFRELKIDMKETQR